jgi:nucleoside-diphosphate-sugar epimerase
VLQQPKQANGEMFCVGPDNALTIENLVEKIAGKMNWKGTVNWNRKPKRDGEIYVLNSTAAKAERLLGWKPTVDLDTGLDRVIQLWKDKKQ